MIPPLEPHCGSWIIVRRATGEPVLETFERATAERVNQTAYAVFTAAQWLGALNQAIKTGHADYCRVACDELERKN